MSIKKLLLLTISMLLIINGCAENVSPNKYTASEVGIASKVIPGVIISKRPVQIDASSNNVIGAASGAVIGAAGGTAIGSNPHSSIAAGVGGAVIGGAIGDAIQKKINTCQGFEYMIKIKDNSIISITQDQDLQFNVGQKILIIYGSMTRIVPDQTSTN